MTARKLYAALTNVGVVSIGEGGNELVSARHTRGLLNFFVGSVDLTVGNVLANAARKEVNVLRDHADAASQGVHRNVANILAVDQDLTRGYLIKTGNERAERCFAATRGTYERDVLTGLYRQIEVCQHVLALGFIMEGNVAKLYTALHVTQIGCVWRVLDLGLGLHNFLESFNTRNALLELLGELHDSTNRGKKCGNKHQISNVVGRGNGGQISNAHHKERTRDDNDDVHQSVKQTGRGVERAHDAVTLALDAQILAVAACKFSFFLVLASKGACYANAEQAILNLRVELTDLLARLAEVCAHTAAEEDRQCKNEGNDREDDKRERNVDGAQQNECANDLNARNKELLGAVVSKLGHVKQVGRNA